MNVAEILHSYVTWIHTKRISQCENFFLVGIFEIFFSSTNQVYFKLTLLRHLMRLQYNDLCLRVTVEVHFRFGIDPRVVGHWKE